MKKTTTIIIIVVIAVLAVWAVTGYNSLVGMDEGESATNGPTWRRNTSAAPTSSPTS